MYAQWIKRELDRTGKSQAELAPAMGLDPVKLSKSLNGSRRLQPHELEGASQFFGVPVPSNALGRLLISTFDPDEADKETEASPERSDGVDARRSWPVDAIPELIAEGGLGNGQVIHSAEGGELNTVDAVRDDYWRFPSHFTRGVLNTLPIHMLVVECTGDSMEPTLRSGDRVYVNTAHKVPSPDGLYAVRDVFDQVIVKRIEVAQEAPLRLRIISDNPKHIPREVGPDEVRIIGKVVAGLKLF